MKARPFISYAHEDREWALRIYHYLRRFGADPWLDCVKLEAGADWQSAVIAALHKATHIITLVSRNSMSKRGFVQKELRDALVLLQNFPPGSTFIVPVRIDAIRPSHQQLAALHWIDMFVDARHGLRQLRDALKLRRRRVNRTITSPSSKLPAVPWLPPNVVAAMLEHPEAVMLGGEVRELTVMVASIHDLYTIMRRRSAEEVLDVINTFYSNVAAFVLEYDGAIDQMADGKLRAFWNAPVSSADHVRRAVECALSMVTACKQNARRQRARQSPMSVGIAVGPAVVGLLGTERIFGYSMVGRVTAEAEILARQAEARAADVLTSRAVANTLSPATWQQFGVAFGRVGSLRSVYMASRAG